MLYNLHKVLNNNDRMIVTNIDNKSITTIRSYTNRTKFDVSVLWELYEQIRPQTLVAQETWVRVINNSGEILRSGSVVAINNNNDSLEITCTTVHRNSVVGVVQEDLNIGAAGFLLMSGVDYGVQTRE